MIHLQRDLNIIQEENQTFLEKIEERDELVAQLESQMSSQEQTLRNVDETYQEVKREMIRLGEELGRYHHGGANGVDLNAQVEQNNVGESGSGSDGGGVVVVPNVMVANLSSEVKHMSVTISSLRGELQRQERAGDEATAELHRAIVALTSERDAVRALVDESSRQMTDRQQSSTDDFTLTQRQKNEQERRCRELLVTTHPNTPANTHPNPHTLTYNLTHTF